MTKSEEGDIDNHNSLKEALQSLRGIKEFCINIDKECGENAVEQCGKLNCVAKIYAIKKKVSTTTQTTLKNYFLIFYHML